MTITPAVHIPLISYLTADGQLADSSPKCAQDFDQLKHYYKNIQLSRLFDKKMIALQRTGNIGTYPSCLGQEAIGCVIGSLLQAEDVFVPYYRDTATQLLRGVQMEEIIAYWGGDERGNHFQNNPQDLPWCVPIATQLTHAAGIATAFKIRKQDHIALVTCGDGATSRGDFYEALNVAGVWNLPLVVVINNNQWAISTPRRMQSATTTLAQKALAAGISGIRVDGNDIIALHEVLTTAIDQARAHKGATLIEAVTYRLGDHTTADDASRYREKAEVEKAWQEEPLRRLNHYLRKFQAWDDEQEKNWQQACEEKIQTAVNNYLAMPPQAAEDFFDYLYAELPAELIAQKQAFCLKAADQLTKN